MNHDDGEQLRAFAEGRDERGFAEVVRRHVGLVYSAALRRVGGDAHRAQEVTQRVFTDLARKAGTLARHPALSAWLHRSTRFAAAKLLREERRRKAREEVFATQAEIDACGERETSAADWRAVEGVIDEALDELREADREAVVLRFFSGMSFSEIGARLGVGENAAQMRTARALEKLRRALERRGVGSATAALGSALTRNAVVAAPADVASGAIAAANAGVAAGGGIGAAVSETFLLMNTSKAVGGAVVAAVLLGAGFVGGRAVSSGDSEAARIAAANAHDARRGGGAAKTEEALRAALADKERLAAELVAARAKADKLAKTVEEQGARLAKFDEAVKGGEKGRLFKDVKELGKYTAEVSLRALDFLKRYPNKGAQPKPGTPEYAQMIAEAGKITEDNSVIMQDPMFLEEMQSNDPARMAALQLAYIGEMMNFSESQRALFQSAIEAGYREAYAKNVAWGDPKNPDLKRINEEAVAKLKETLTPAQLEIFNQAKFGRMLFNFSVGGG